MCVCVWCVMCTCIHILYLVRPTSRLNRSLTHYIFSHGLTGINRMCVTRRVTDSSNLCPPLCPFVTPLPPPLLSRLSCASLLALTLTGARHLMAPCSTKETRTNQVPRLAPCRRVLAVFGRARVRGNQGVCDRPARSIRVGYVRCRVSHRVHAIGGGVMWGGGDGRCCVDSGRSSAVARE